MEAKSNSYMVGYGKPPKNRQFKPGRSGNPGGRPRGSLNIATILQRELGEKVTIDEGRQKKTMTKLEVATRRIVERATCGELKPFQFLVAWLGHTEDAHTVQPNAPDPVLSKIDDKFMLNILKRIETCNQGGVKDDISK